MNLAASYFCIEIKDKHVTPKVDQSEMPVAESRESGSGQKHDANSSSKDSSTSARKTKRNSNQDWGHVDWNKTYSANGSWGRWNSTEWNEWQAGGSGASSSGNNRQSASKKKQHVPKGKFFIVSR